LKQPAARVHLLSKLLSRDERERLRSFHFERDRRRIIVCHGVLRIILGRYLEIDASEFKFGFGPRGKPYLVSLPSQSTLQFNMAHSDELSLYAVACGFEVGIDVEYIRPIPNAEQIAAHVFSTDEYSKLSTLSQSKRLQGFFNCWTRKEAYIKANGRGLTDSLKSFDVSLIPGEPARLLNDTEPQNNVTQWQMVAFVPSPGYVAAVAMKQTNVHLEYCSLF